MRSSNTTPQEGVSWRSHAGFRDFTKTMRAPTAPDLSSFRVDLKSRSVDGIELERWRVSPLAGVAPVDPAPLRRFRIDILTAGTVEYRLHDQRHVAGAGTAHLLPCWEELPFAIPVPTEVLRLTVPTHFFPAPLRTADGVFGPMPRSRLVDGLAALSEQVLHDQHVSSPATRVLRELCLATLTESAEPVLDLRDRILLYIDSHLGDHDLSPSSIADAFDISLRWVHRIVNRDGITIASYIRRRRCEEVARHLERTDGFISISRLADLYGFNGRDQLTRAFKAQYGHTTQQHAEP